MPGRGARRNLKVRHDDDFEFKALCAVNRHELHAAIAAGGGVGLRFEIVEGRVERGAEEIGFALQGESRDCFQRRSRFARASASTHCRAAELQPDLFEPGAER